MKIIDAGIKPTMLSVDYLKLKGKTIISAKNELGNVCILLKVHKPFSSLLVGRPISSTLHVSNGGIATLLDKILEPLILRIGNLILCSPHQLLLLQNLKLDLCCK